MTTVFGAGLTLMVLYAVGRMVMGGFNSNRALLRTRSSSCQNANLMMAAASLAGLLVSIISNGARWRAVTQALGPLLVIGGILVVIALVTRGPGAGAILGLMAFGAEVVSASLEHGAGGGLTVIVLAMFFLFTLGIVRGITG